MTTMNKQAEEALEGLDSVIDDSFLIATMLEKAGYKGLSQETVNAAMTLGDVRSRLRARLGLK